MKSPLQKTHTLTINKRNCQRRMACRQDGGGRGGGVWRKNLKKRRRERRTARKFTGGSARRTEDARGALADSWRLWRPRRRIRKESAARVFCGGYNEVKLSDWHAPKARGDAPRIPCYCAPTFLRQLPRMLRGTEELAAALKGSGGGGGTFPTPSCLLQSD